jgi:hypothetical protein
VIEVRPCAALQEAAGAPSFYKRYVGSCQDTIPFGDGYESWRAEIDQRMREGYEIASLGPHLQGRFEP